MPRVVKSVKRSRATATDAAKCRRKFLTHFPGGFRDPTYLDWERDYKVQTHRRWEQALSAAEFACLIHDQQFAEVAARALRVEQQSRHSMLFSFEKMALRDAVRTPDGARAFANGLYDWLHGPEPMEVRFTKWCDVVGLLPRKQTRVLTWPVVTVFGFIAQPQRHLFLKPMVTRIAARKYGFDFDYHSRPALPTYQSLMKFAETVKHDLKDLKPRDLIDIQSFIWVQGSEEYLTPA